MSNGLNFNIAIIACAKREELYIKEWIDWNLSIGVDHIFIADNNDSSYTPTLYDVIKEYVDNNEVTIYNYNDIHPIQPICYTDIYEHHSDEYDWFYICDIDEFLHIPSTNNDIKQFILNFSSNTDSIVINWRSYDDNDLIYYDNRPVQERFTRLANTSQCVNGTRRIIKSIIKSKKYNKNFKAISFHDPLGSNTKVNRVNVLGIYHSYCSADEAGDIYEKYKIAYIAHFETKTLEEYYWKINRGDTLKEKTSDLYPYKLSKFWTLNNKTPEKLELFDKIQSGQYEYNSNRK